MLYSKKLSHARSIKMIALWAFIAFFLTGCGNRYEDQLRQQHTQATASLDYLKTQIDNKLLSNILLIEKYAKTLVSIKPDYKDIALLLNKESTSKGRLFSTLEQRLKRVVLNPKSDAEASQSANEIQLIQAASDVYEYNRSLVDTVNTLASLSDGALAEVNVPQGQSTTAQQSNALVGNPAYGHWKTNSNGTSFWAWYGMYSMFNNVLGRNSYSSWSSRPHYSYYDNYGRNRWGSSADVAKNYNLSKKNPSRYNQPSRATKARYSQASNRSSSFSNRSSSSSYSNNRSRSSSYGSSSRSSSFSSSRSSFSGK